MILYQKIKDIFFIFCAVFECIICVKTIINLFEYSNYKLIIQLIVLIGYQANFVGLMNKLDYEHALRMELFHMQGLFSHSVMPDSL